MVQTARLTRDFHVVDVIQTTGLTGARRQGWMYGRRCEGVEITESVLQVISMSLNNKVLACTRNLATCSKVS